MTRNSDQSKEETQGSEGNYPVKSTESNAEKLQNISESLDKLRVEIQAMDGPIAEQRAENLAMKKKNAEFKAQQAKRFRKLQKEAATYSFDNMRPTPARGPIRPIQPIQPTRLRPPANLAAPSIEDWQIALDDD